MDRPRRRTHNQRSSEHVDGSMTGRYVQYDYDREKRDALERWAEHISRPSAGSDSRCERGG